ncbi:hypothetical protein ACJIZ3_021443 [Penstemon smallii]|uniref:Uncharacterized protein n=1 Tax=Penstemon smallii TaxID=265156 RepID=A0ABD3SLE3_9LAMI
MFEEGEFKHGLSHHHHHHENPHFHHHE